MRLLSCCWERGGHRSEDFPEELVHRLLIDLSLAVVVLIPVCSTFALRDAIKGDGFGERQATRCRDARGALAIATRARWRVVCWSDVLCRRDEEGGRGERKIDEGDVDEVEVVISISKSTGEDGEYESVGAGERGKVMESEAGE